jgi:hypothetical protein
MSRAASGSVPTLNLKPPLLAPQSIYWRFAMLYVLRLLAASVVHSVILEKGFSRFVLVNAPTLAYMMEQCQSLKCLSLKDLDMNEDQIRVLGALSRPGLRSK